jgi:putative ABC transport system substrate-binding protein
MLLLLGALLPSAAAAAATDVLILESSTARPYQAARESLLQALPKDLRVDQLSLDSEDPAKDAERVRAFGARVFVTLGTQATTWALSYTRVTPIVFAMVLHPVQSNLVRSFHAPGDRITGAALDISPEVQLRTLRDILGVRRVGVLYDPAETETLVEAARKAARRSGTELVTVPVSEPGKLEEALGKLNGRVEALWSVPDRTVFGRGAVEKVLLYTLLRAGALLALTVSYTENGRQAAEQVQAILAGEQAASLPVVRPQSIEVVFNAHIAHRLKRRVPQGARIIRAGLVR